MSEHDAHFHITPQQPHLHWDDVAGLKEAKATLRHGIALGLESPASFARLGSSPPSTALLIGPHGTGKSRLAHACATQANASWIPIDAHTLLANSAHTPSISLHKIFARAKRLAPSVIFLDHLHELFPCDAPYTRHTLIHLLDQHTPNDRVALFAATSHPSLLPASLLQNHRFDHALLIGTPNEDTRLTLLKTQTQNLHLEANVSLHALAQRTSYYTPLDLERLCQLAATFALKQDPSSSLIPRTAFEKALGALTPSSSSSLEDHHRAQLTALFAPPL